MKKKYSLLSNFISLWEIMNHEERKKTLMFIFFTFILVILETLSIGSLYPLLLGIFGNNTKVFNNDLFTLDFLQKYLDNTNQVFLISAVILLMFLLKNSFIIFVVHWSQTFERNIKIRLKRHLLWSYLNNDYLFHVNSDSAKLVRNINTSTSTIMGAVRMSMTYINDFTLFIFLLIFMITINPLIVIFIAILVSSISFIYFIFFKKMLIKYGKFTFEHEGESLKRLMQSFSLIKEIKLFNKEKYFLNFFNSEEKLFQEFQRKAYIIRSYPRIFFELIFVIGILLFININVLGSSESISEILPKTALIGIILIRMIPSLNKIISSAQRINQFQKSNDEIIKELQDKTLIQKESYIEDDIVRENFKFEKISLENVSFSYDKKKEKIFDNFNLEIKKGNYIGIVGSSGSGKSTLIDILTGLLNTTDGKIKLNNEIAEVGTVQWKQIFGYVTQSVNLFNDTIYANIAFETDINKVDKLRLNDALKKSGLIRFVNRLDKGINTFVGEFGYKISGGEKQRLSIARALYKNSQILIFDESFNSLDNETKKIILDEIKKLSETKTIIIISHNINDLKDCDKIIDLNK
jgi:ATP-binding cassette, subfamily B, bacterial PglK